MSRTCIDLDGQTDLPITEANLQRLGDNSIVDDLHRHSKLTGPAGNPDPALYVDNDGRIILSNGANIGQVSDTDLLALAANKLTINGALELTKGLKLPLKTTLAVNSEFAVGECWIYNNTANGRFYLAYKDENASGKAVELVLDVTLT